jgi:hypothetical protein
MNRYTQPKIHRSATTYGAQNFISDTLLKCVILLVLTAARGLISLSLTKCILFSESSVDSEMQPADSETSENDLQGFQARPLQDRDSKPQGLKIPFCGLHPAMRTTLAG